MNSIIQDIFYGNLDPAGDIVSQDPKYGRLWKQVSKERDYINAQLNPEARACFADMENHMSEAFCMNIYAGYAYGLRQGVRLCLDLLEPQNPCR